MQNSNTSCTAWMHKSQPGSGKIRAQKWARPHHWRVCRGVPGLLLAQEDVDARHTQPRAVGEADPSLGRNISRQHRVPARVAPRDHDRRSRIRKCLRNDAVWCVLWVQALQHRWEEGVSLVALTQCLHPLLTGKLPLPRYITIRSVGESGCNKMRPAGMNGKISNTATLQACCH